MSPSCHASAFICFFLFLSACCFVQGEKPGSSEGHVLIISDRAEAVAVAVQSILMNSKSKVTIWIITTTPIDVDTACFKLTRRDDQLIRVLDFEWINGDLVSAGINPIWFWRDYGRSITERKKWLTKSSLRVGTWDHNPMHFHRLTMLRFYLAKLPALASIKHIFVMDDDVILRHDISLVYERMNLQKNTVLVGTCSNWAYKEEKCSYSSAGAGKLFNSAALYLTAPRCSLELRENCLPHNYVPNLHWLRHRLNNSKLDFNKSQLWNYGFAMVDLEKWRRFNLTEEFQWMMAQVYKLRLFPETSLAFGFGVGFLLLADYVQCWEEFEINIFDGAGYITDWDVAVDGKPAITDQTFAIHWSGNDKPWRTGSDAGSKLRASFRLPWLEISQMIGMQSSNTPKPVVRVVCLTDTDLASNWCTDILGKHPQVCTSAASGRFSFPRAALAPPSKRHSQESTCRADRLCTWDTIVNSVPALIKRYERFCDGKNGTMKPENWFLCKWAKTVTMTQALAREEARWQESSQKSKVGVVDMLKKMYVDLIFGDLNLNDAGSQGVSLPCDCPADRHVRVFTVGENWLQLAANRNLFAKSPKYKFPWESVKIIRLSQQKPPEGYMNLRANDSSTSVASDTKKIHPMSLKNATNLKILPLDYDDCMRNGARCLRAAVNFIGVEASEDIIHSMGEA